LGACRGPKIPNPTNPRLGNEIAGPETSSPASIDRGFLTRGADIAAEKKLTSREPIPWVLERRAAILPCSGLVKIGPVNPVSTAGNLPIPALRRRGVQQAGEIRGQTGRSTRTNRKGGLGGPP
jgi:hypothetical protein